MIFTREVLGHYGRTTICYEAVNLKALGKSSSDSSSKAAAAAIQVGFILYLVQHTQHCVIFTAKAVVLLRTYSTEYVQIITSGTVRTALMLIK